MSEIQSVKYLIIGAGLSGLSCAYYLGDDYLILEKDSVPGGYCRTIPNERYIWDYAGHFYHFRMDKYKELFLDLVEEDQIVRQKKNTKIYYKNKLIDYPFQTNIHELEKEEFIECLYDLYFRDKNGEYNNFLDMLYGKFGESIVEKFLRPYNEKLYATDLRKLDKDAMGRFFPYADFDKVMGSMKDKVEKTYNDEFMYLKQGTGYFIDKLFDKIKKEKVLFNSSVIRIDRDNKIVRTIDGKEIHYENLINTMPLNQFLDVMGEEKWTEYAKNLSYNKVLVFNLGFDGPSPRYRTEHWVYYPDKTLNFYRVGFYNNILNQDELNVYVEIGFPKEVSDINIEGELEKTISGMKRVGIIDDSLTLVDKSVILMDPAYVHINNEEKIKEQLENFEKDNIYMLGRYGRWTYNSMEDCMLLADNLAKALKNE